MAPPPRKSQISLGPPHQKESIPQLLTMPQEILDRIAEFVLDTDTDAYLSVFWEPDDGRKLESNGCELMDLAMTCRLLFKTSIMQLYSKRYFHFYDHYDAFKQPRKSAWAIFAKFVQQIGRINASYITRVVFWGSPKIQHLEHLMQLSQLRHMEVMLSGVSFKGSEAKGLTRFLRKLRLKHVPSLITHQFRDQDKLERADRISSRALEHA